MGEKAIIGWGKIAGMFNASESAFRAKHKRTLIEGGFVFYQFVGRPAKRCVCAFPRMLMEWAAEKAKKNEMV